MDQTMTAGASPLNHVHISHFMKS